MADFSPQKIWQPAAELMANRVVRAMGLVALLAGCGAPGQGQPTLGDGFNKIVSGFNDLTGRTPKDSAVLETLRDKKGIVQVELSGSQSGAAEMGAAFDKNKKTPSDIVTAHVDFTTHGGELDQFGSASHDNHDKRTVEFRNAAEILGYLASNVATINNGRRQVVDKAVVSFGKNENYGKATCTFEVVERIAPGGRQTVQSGQCGFSLGNLAYQMN